MGTRSGHFTREGFLADLHDALHNLYEPDHLRESPLAALLGVERRLDTFQALQSILIRAIDALKPGPDAAPQAGTWEIYEPLLYRYVHQLNQRQVAAQLGMSVRHLRRKEHAAIEVLAGHLWREYDLEGKASIATEREEGQDAEPAPTETPSVRQELAWLKTTPPERPTDLRAVLSDVAGLAQSVARQHNVHMAVSEPEGQTELFIHDIALSQALLNLVSAAIHASDGGAVSVSVRTRPGAVVLEVTGAKQGCAATNAGETDDAASLALAEQLVALCRGRLVVASNTDPFSARVILPTPEYLSVLVIDDNVDTLQLLQRYTVGTRYRLVPVDDPEQALAVAEAAQPRIIVLDVMMPHVDGWRLLTQLRQHAPTSDIPIVVSTILPQQETAFALGASGFIRKPLSRQAFLSALDRQLAPAT